MGPFYQCQVARLGLWDEREYQLNYYIAGTDSCAGDSGGALVTWVPEIPFPRPVLIGVVSRYKLFILSLFLLSSM